ncbi:MAG: hypothetical protein JXR25_07430 [Pontiellaceae bacterium]|nr:hypothetical protein [Pontiellaceae bacterium]MBN2784643.1 hypothetical protein [Pontiellaceae bacterium]
MQIKSIAMLAVAGCAIGMLTGCGVPQEEHDAIVAQLNSEHQMELDKVNTELQDTKSLQKAAEDSVRSLRADLRDSTALNDELKETNKSLKGELADVRSDISSLESQLKSAKASIQSAQAMASDAESERATMEMEARETQRRFDELILNLAQLNGVKPSDVGFPELDGMVESAVPMVEDMGMDVEVEESGSSSAADLLEQMGAM